MAVLSRAIGSMMVGFCLVACGAKSLAEPGESLAAAPRATSDPPPRATSDSSPPKSNRGSGVRLDEGARLGPCEEGFVEREHPDRDCNCISDGVCFDTKAEACACICPRDSSHNTCVSQWDCEKDSRTKVSCYAL
jgi:hypothetical protein